ncbi:Very-long-chain 3-ketoacyl-CoA synthase [Carpediemonas membranifera]|uniref:3-ketoacyl-CoA synthase n=1 Tax=Carpediemonas membranifera TaxID=201153 RepID=A0A8J6AY72_9EUKA|nr:Very-long-chain 3-ketoacyl-CoA synthase [Carpediemonas membranifera]|eukprot:KAG9394365.1 Very-long-chain 3-ketoacyl-CoA synthase [Carpediemonas membranifera]
MSVVIIEDTLSYIAANVAYTAVVVSILLVAFAWRFITHQLKRRVFVEDFYCYQPSKDSHHTAQDIFDNVIMELNVSDGNKAFLGKMMMRSGLGNDTSAPHNMMNKDFSAASNHREMELYLESAMDGLLARTGMNAKDIDFLVVNCSCYCPTPSMTAWIVNHYKMPSKVRTFQIGGMGCSASMIGVDLINDLLKANPGKNAVLVSTEVLTSQMYHGEDPSYSLQGALFRSGAAAILFSGKKTRMSRYEVLHCIRTHHGRRDDAHNCILLQEDPQGYRGVRLNKEIPKVAGKAIEENMTRLGEAMLPLSEKLKFIWINMVLRKALGRTKVAMYQPDFKKVIHSYCIHTGGRGVIDTVEKNLRLSPEHVEASRATLYQYGNTSSSSVWYELAYLEQHKLTRPGHVIWQIAFGSGFKANSCVLKALPGCKKNPVDFNVHNPTWRYSKETCPPPTLEFPPNITACIEAHRAQKAAAGSQ